MSADAVARILANYQAALLLVEEVAGDAVDAAALRAVSREVLAPVLAACAGLTVGADPASVAGERARIAAAHSRVLRHGATVADPGRLAELEAGSHSAAALFALLRSRL